MRSLSCALIGLLLVACAPATTSDHTTPTVVPDGGVDGGADTGADGGTGGGGGLDGGADTGADGGTGGGGVVDGGADTGADGGTGGGGGNGGSTPSPIIVFSISPAHVTAGSPAFTLTITGINFTSDSVVLLGGTPVAATLVDAATLTVPVSAAAVASAGALAVAVWKADGSASSQKSLLVSASGPLVDHSTPAAAWVGLPYLTVTLVGTGFVPSSSVSTGNMFFSTNYVDSEHLEVWFPGTALTVAATLPLTVTGPEGTTTYVEFPVLPPPAPTVASISPNLVIAGSDATSVTITGSGFVPSTTVTLDGVPLSTIFHDRETLFTWVPASALASFGTVDLVVSTPSPGGGTVDASITVGWPAPTVDQVSPSSVVHGSGSLTATIVGSRFAPGSTVSWGDQPLVTTYVDASTLRATVPAAAFATAGSLELEVTNPAPGGGTTHATLTVEPDPVLQSLTPSEGHVGSSITLAGAHFGSAGTRGTVTLGGLPLTIVSWSNSSIVASIPSGAIAGQVQVHAGAAASSTQLFTVTATVAGQLVDGSSAANLNGSWARDGGGVAQLAISAVEAGRSTVAHPTVYAGFPQTFSLELPLGTHTFNVQELDEQGSATIDLLQAASRQVTGITVDENGIADLHIPVLWHWELHALDPGFPVCGREKQIHFRDADHGFVTFQVDADVDASLGPDRIGKIHGAVMATSDGGKSWSMVSHDISVGIDDFRPTAGSWFTGGYLLALDDGQTVLSMGENGALVRSTDSGQTWAPAWLDWANLGTGGAGPTRFARAGSTLYTSIVTGGVQGSVERSNLVYSTDKGATWTRKYDVCGISSYAPSGCPQTGTVPLGFAGLDMACSDVDDKHCISMGYEHDNYTSLVMVTTDGFDTFTMLQPPAGGYFTGLVEVAWIPNTLTAWIVAGSSDANTGMQYRVTHDGGANWTDWQRNPPGGRFVFTGAQEAVMWWDSGVWLSHDATATWRYTGHAPSATGALRSVDVLDADHKWVLGNPDCRDSSAAYVARWVP